MAVRRRRGGRSSGRRKQNVEWANISAVTPVAMTNSTLFVEIIPDAMANLNLAPDFLVKRIVGTINVQPQAAATATSTIGFAIFRSVHGVSGTRVTTVDPIDVDVDAGSEDILWQWQGQPQYGAPFDATALDLSFEIKIDLRTKGSLRKLDKRHGIQLSHKAETTARVQFSFKFRVLGALSI